MTHNHTKTNLKARDGAHNRNEPHKRGLLLRFIIFMAWVIVIGLLLSPLACTVQISDDTNEHQGGDYE